MAAWQFPLHFGNRVIQEGDQVIILIESNGPSGFFAEIGRIICLGKVSPELKEQFELAQKAQRVTLDLLNVGTDPVTIWNANNEFMRSIGYPEETRIYAHGMGYDMVEQVVSASSQASTEPVLIADGRSNLHMAWVETQREHGGLGGTLNYPLLADLNKTVAETYGILAGGVALRGLFLISPEGRVMHATINNLAVGRSAKEALRTLKAFMYVSSHEGEVCPADWDEGDDTMKADADGMKKYLSSH